MKTITMLGSLPPNKGISEVCVEQVRHLARRLKVQFIDFKQMYPDFLYPGGSKAPDGKTVEFDASVEVHRKITWYNPLSWIQAGFAVQGEILHLHWWTYYLFPPKFTAVLVAKLRGKKVIASVHNVVGHESNFLDRLWSGIFVRQMDFIITHSDVNRQKLLETFNVDPAKVEVVPMGIPDHLVGQTEKTAARAKLGIPADKKVLLTFGHIRKYKGVDVLLKAYAKVRKERADLELIVAGKPWIDWAPMQKIIDDENLKPGLRLDLDYVDAATLKLYFSAADLIVLPYIHFDAQSGPGRVALGYQLPMIVTEVGGLPDLVKDRGACVAKPGDVDDLARKMSRILGDSQLLARLSRDAQEKREEFSWERSVDRTVGIYSKLLS